jgi:hypothetical protein
MAQILLVKFGESEERRLAEFFGTQGHRVSSLDDTKSLSCLLDNVGKDLDLAILHVSANCDAEEDLETLRRHRDTNGLRPMVLCVSRVYRGPRFELEIERKGGRLVYVL